MRLTGKDRGDVAIERLIVERLPAADLVGVAAETGGELVMHDPSFPCRGSAQLMHAPEPLPVGETGGANGGAASRGTGCTEQGGAAVEEAGRKPIRSAPGAAPQATDEGRRAARPVRSSG